MFVFAQLIFCIAVKCGTCWLGGVRGQCRCCLFLASARQRPVNHKPNESQMNTAAFADHSAISCAHWSVSKTVIQSSATNSASRPFIILHKLDRLENPGFDICKSFLKILRGWINCGTGGCWCERGAAWVKICMIARRERPACCHWILILVPAAAPNNSPHIYPFSFHGMKSEDNICVRV